MLSSTAQQPTLRASGPRLSSVAESGSVPVSGLYPTNAWRPGEIITDFYALPIAPTLPPGGYRLEIGLFPPFAATEARFAKYQEAERILVEDVGAIFLTHMLIYQIFWPYFTGIPKDITGREVYRGLDITFSQVYIRDDIAEWDTPRTK